MLNDSHCDLGQTAERRFTNMAFRFVSLIALLAITAGPVLAQNFEKEIKVAFAHHAELGGVVHNQEGIETVVQALRLSNAQAGNFRSLIEARNQEMENLTTEIHDKRMALHKALEQSSPNAMEVGTLTVSIQELEGRMTAINERFQNAFSNMLTAEQRATFDGLRNAANQLEAFHMTGLIGPKMMTHDFVIGTGATKGMFMKFVEGVGHR